MTGPILLIETDVVLSAVIGEVLRQHGYEVMFLRSLSLKREALHSPPLSAVIVDIDTLSEEKELALVELLQQYGESLPIVLMGLQIPDGLCQRLRARLHKGQVKNMTTWLQKPFRNEDLLAAIRQVQESYRFPPSPVQQQ
ncbi:MAG: response regulator [Nitrospira sp. CR1.3]|nr:response regulator [Nitrospira sp. CR1.3]